MIEQANLLDVILGEDSEVVKILRAWSLGLRYFPAESPEAP
jgi:hypothetical protein